MPFDVTSDGLAGGPTSWSFEITPPFREVLTHRAAPDKVPEGVVLLGLLTGDVRPCDDSAVDAEIWSNAPHTAPPATTPGPMVRSVKKLVLKRLGPLSEPRSDLVWKVIRQAELSTVSDVPSVSSSAPTPPAAFTHDGATITITAAASSGTDAQCATGEPDKNTSDDTESASSESADGESNSDPPSDASTGSNPREKPEITDSAESNLATDETESPTAPSHTTAESEEVAAHSNDEQLSDDESPAGPPDADDQADGSSPPAVDSGSPGSGATLADSDDETKTVVSGTATDEPTEPQSTSPAPATGTSDDSAEASSAAESSSESASDTGTDTTETSSSILEEAAAAATENAQGGETTADTASSTETDDVGSSATSKYDTSSSSPLRDRDTTNTPEGTSSETGTGSATTESNGTNSSDGQSSTVSSTDDTNACPFCGETYPSKQVVARHANQCRRRPSGKTFDCDHCDKQFASPPARDLHQRECDGSKEGQSGLLCDNCGEKFATPSQLTTHQQRCGTRRTQARANPDGERRSGVMTEYNSDGSYGFLRITPESHSTAAKQRAFLHVSDCDGQPSVGDVVEFTLVDGDDGPRAEKAIITEKAPADTAPEPRDTPFSSKRSRWGRDS